MCALSLTGRPKPPPSSGWLLLLMLVTVMFLHGCASTTYQSVPECQVAEPPKTEAFAKAGPDERLVLMTTAYIRQTKAVTECNADIRLVNASNHAVTP